MIIIINICKSKSDDMLTTLRVTQRTWLYGTRLKPGIIYMIVFLCLLFNSSLKVKTYLEPCQTWMIIFFVKITDNSIMNV